MFINGNDIGRVIPKSFFGMHINAALPKNKNPFNGVECPMFSDLGYGAIRLWDGYVCQRLINGSVGVYDWSALDYRVQKAEENGLEIMYTFGAMPNFATSSPGPSANYNPNPPTSLTFLTDFAAALAQRYKGRIKYYETWNEVDSSGSWTGTVDQMRAIGAALYPVLKAADPDAVVLSPNCISFGSLNTMTGLYYIEQYLKTNKDFCDAISMHFYTDPSQPESYVWLGEAYKNLAERYGKTKVICSETGVLRYYAPNGAIKKPLTNGAQDFMSEDQGASWMARILMCAWLGGVDMNCYYMLDNVNNIMAINLIDYTPSGQVASVRYKPARAYRYIATLLTGGKLGAFSQVGDFCRAKFETRAGRSGDVFWCLDYKTKTINTMQYRSITDVEGLDVARSASYSLTNSPIFCFTT